MNDLREVSCPACSKSLRFKATSSKQVAMSCPNCNHFFQVELAQPVRPGLVQATLATSPAPAQVIAKPVASTSPTRTSVPPPPPATSNSERNLPDLEFPVPEFPAAGFPTATIPQRVVKTRRPASAPASPILTKVIPIAAGIVLVLGILGFVGYRAVSSLDLTAMLDVPTVGDPTDSEATSSIEGPNVAQSDSTLATSNISSNISSSTTVSQTLPDTGERIYDQAPSNMSTGPAATVEPTPRTSAPPTPGLNHTTSPDPLESPDMNSGSSSSSLAMGPSIENNSPAPSNSFAPSSEPRSLADVIEQAEKSVIRIEVVGNDGDSLGSGFVVDDRGTFVTNCHVLAGAKAAAAFFPNGQRCQVVGTYVIDESRDIVIGKISINSAPAIALSNGLPRKGDRITALGSPFGLAFTASNGIVSAIRTEGELGDDRKGTWIQVDAPLSPGNSGGPLINAAGEVVAMSTLASQGAAQNLNFGISGQDISTAIKQAPPTVQPLALGVGKIRMKSESSSSPGSLLAEAKIAEESLNQYVSAGTQDFKDLLRGIRNEAYRLGNDLKEMRKGATSIPRDLRVEDAAVVRVAIPGQRYYRWFFLNENIKSAVIARQQEKIKKYNNLKTEIKTPDDADSLTSLLWNFGPPLDPRKTKAIGFASGLLVLHAFNDHDVLVLLEDTPYLLWAPSTAGLSAGEIIDGPVYVAGTSTAEMRNGLTTSLTVLQLLDESQLRSAIEKATNGGFRMWSDRSGSFQVEAKLLGKDSAKVVLQKRDGSIVNVPLASLSQADSDFLGP